MAQRISGGTLSYTGTLNAQYRPFMFTAGLRENDLQRFKVGRLCTATVAVAYSYSVKKWHT